ncbi:hypothetical protein DWB90_09065 [Staphylococcus chromogenes]|nr:hypothetical protein DWB90_08775 [Staphylococcus chromogenes]QDX01180.1 hypothetical protein DWB90_09065 [Staphylococcus chromogenes]
MELRLSQNLLNELEEHGYTEEQLINNLYIGKYSVGYLEFAVNKKMDGTIIVDSMHNIDLFGDTEKVIEVEDFDI